MSESSGDEDIAIRCQRLGKQFGEIHALKSLDLSVPSGSVFGFLGRNGAGKTTTIRLLTGLAHPSTGSAWVNGVETTKTDSLAREEFGYLPQDPAFYKWMTPLEYLDYVARLFNMGASERRDRIDELLALVELDKAARRKIGGFSGGMIQRLGIAQALIHRPPVLFLDEPTSSLDPAGRYEVLKLIDGLRGRVTVFLSSHILGDIERVCDRIGIIHEGELLLVATPQELLSRYATNVVVIEFDRNETSHLAPLLSELEDLPWISGVVQSENVLRISVKQTETAKRSLLPLVAKHDLQTNSYNWERPSLEEVFLRISE